MGKTGKALRPLVPHRFSVSSVARILFSVLNTRGLQPGALSAEARLANARPLPPELRHRLQQR